MSTPANVLVETIGRVAVLTINRAEKRNALDQATRKEFIQALDALRHNDAIRVVVVTGAGDKAFVAGADITEFEGRTPVDQYRVMNEPTIFAAVDQFPKPVIAMINGSRWAAGASLRWSVTSGIAADSAS
jgi:enoyl-CoA hydratase